MIPTYNRCNPVHRQCSWYHTRLVTDYREERQRQEMELDEASYGYATEARELSRARPLITFKIWLVNMRRDHGQPSTA